MNIRTSFIVQLFPKEGQVNANNYYICIYKNMDTGKKITCKGYGLPRDKGIQYDMELEAKQDPVRGLQYQMISYKDHVEKTQEGIIQYLSSGLIKGIGRKTAEKIYAQFKEQTMEIMDNSIDSLLSVPGITEKKLAVIKISYEEKKEYKELTGFLLGHGFTATEIKHIISHYTKNPLQSIKENPYSLIHVKGIDFYKIEEIAKQLGIAEHDYRRIQGAAIQILKNTMLKGDTCCEINEYTQNLYQLVNSQLINPQVMKEYVVQLIKDHTVYYRKTEGENPKSYIFHASCVQAEHDIAKELLRIKNEKNKEWKNLNKDIIDFAYPLVLDQSQVKALQVSLEENISIITGGPGTGKSTIIRIICDIYEKYYGKDNIILASPTGRAARRMEECTNRPSQTIHHLLRMGIAENGEEIFQTEDVTIENKLIIVDEFSMVDTFVCQQLLKNIKNCQFIMVGDAQQLESVGPGAVLKELIKSKVIPTTVLESTHRQEHGSSIVINAKKMEKCQTDLITDDDFIINEISDMMKIEEVMVSCVVEKVQEIGLENVLCLCPFKENYGGVSRMNKILQHKLNPYGKRWAKTERDYRIGDPVMHLKNSDEISNGDIGYITNFIVKNTEQGEQEEFLEVTYFQKLRKLYKVEDLPEITLAYATTVHKSQGSEAKTVVTCLSDYHLFVLKDKLKRNLPYTSFTRGKQEVIFLGSRKALCYAICNVKERNTLLSYEIRKQFGLIKKEPKEEKKQPKEVYEQLKMAL